MSPMLLKSYVIQVKYVYVHLIEGLFTSAILIMIIMKSTGHYKNEIDIIK